MPCYHPLRGTLTGPPGGRSINFSTSSRGKPISIPCGRCIGCRLERARQWAVRLMHECSLHDDSFFLTLTYNARHLPKLGSLVVRDCQLFMKRFRERIKPVKVRFFLCGEYGEKLGRPHYHCILFGYGFPDKILLKKKGDFQIYRSPLLDDCWGMGDCEFGGVSFDSACYVANYATKKVTNKESYLDSKGKRWPSAEAHYQGRKPEFLLMSRGGRHGRGIGFDWLHQFANDVYHRDEVIVNGRPARPPRYYDELMREHHPEVMEALAAKREVAAEELEDFSFKSSRKYKVARGRNARRLAVREQCALAKQTLKSRNLEISNVDDIRGL